MTTPAYQQMIFINLPVADLAASKEFFTGLGYSLNPQFSDDNAASVVISDTIVAMLLTKPFYATFTKKEIADATKTSEVMIALSAETRAAVDTVVDRALELGATEPRDPQNMEGFMYGRAFDDLDGHTWEVIWMDPSAMEG
ncbi:MULTISPECIES: VOC family protein [unclassified Streptomyces]|uniref:VOC family protein n=1 Tax=unclassified Streptomyces TaxID=2593676 RepID=UPI000DD910F7|nr:MULTISPECIES: VOC family protein [unclassified Streptomyces]QZZ30499.1 VOC family protein [Streptomyces sp. ST1015]